jgi:hypothetical protein
LPEPPLQPGPDEIRRFGIEPDYETWEYDVNACANCGQPVLIRWTREKWPGARNSIAACEYCYNKLSKRTRAAQHEYIFLKGWRPG